MVAGDVTGMALVKALSVADGGLGVVSTARPDGTVHSSVVTAGLMPHPVTGVETVAFVVFGSARKLGFFRKSGRASLVFRAGFQWAGVEGQVDIIGPDDPLTDFPDDGIAELLRRVFRAAGGTHDDWDEYDRVMAAERRAAIFVHPERIVGSAP